MDEVKVTRQRLILIELNEINFDVVSRYLEGPPDLYPSLRLLMTRHAVRTTSEKRYELLEPWVQWASVHTGKSYEEHGVFRLGDMAGSEIPQFFEQLENAGVLIGAISPMNAANRLKKPAYFMPDPWTVTPADDSWWSRALTSAVSQAVNDNSKARIAPSSAFHLILGLARFARVRNYWTYLKLLLGALRAPWRKALFLDLFLHDLHMTLLQARRPGFSVLFLNAGAHIQHHYFLNSVPLRADGTARNPSWYVAPGADPVADMLAIYDRIVADYLDLQGVELIVATGLSQRPYDRVKFYYRLRDHAAFLKLAGIRFRQVLPRMTRDFLVEFDDALAAHEAQERLERIVETRSGATLFADIDNRGASLFVTLTFPDEIRADTEFDVGGARHSLTPHVSFVAIKNGMHQEDGFAFFSKDVARWAPEQGAHVKSLYSCIMGFFAVPPQ